MKARLTSPAEIPAVMELLDSGRRLMRSDGNFVQWPEGYPSRETVENDVRLGQSWLVEDGGRIVGTFVMMTRPEPTYEVIYDGKWSSDGEYVTIHRIAKAEDVHGVFACCMEMCRGKYVRIDTHENNRLMRRLLEKHGFVRCGRILLRDGSPRIAYDLNFE